MKKIYISIAFVFIGSLLHAQVDRSKMPEAGPAPKIELGETQSFTLKNGLKVFVVENHKLPKVAFSLQLDIDPILEKDKVGMLDMAGELLAKGTKNRSKEELNFNIDFIGADFFTSATSVYASSLKKHQAKLLDLMSDVVKNADFKQEELEKQKTQFISGIQTEKDDPDAIARKVRNSLLYGQNHPYGEVMTEETVKNITLADVQNYYATFFKPNVAYLAVVGDVTMKEVKPLIEKYFGDWKKGEVPNFEYDMPEQPAVPVVAFVNKPGAVQSVISVFNTIDLKPGSDDAIAASVANGILGGGFVSKLNLNLREEHSYTYGARSAISPDELVGYFNATAKVRNEVTDSALTEMMKEVMAMGQGDITEDELKTIKNYRTGTFAIGLENPQTKATYALNIEKYGLDEDYYADYLKNLATVTLDDVKEVSKKYVNPMNGYILVVGNQDEVAEKLTRFSPSGTITYYDPNGEIAEAKKLKPAPTGMNAKQVAEKFIEAIGGKKNLEKVESVKMEMSTSMQGMPLTITIVNQMPDNYLSSINMNGMVVEKKVFNGKEGKTSGMQGEQMLGEADIDAMKEESILFPELVYLEKEYEMTLLGIDTKNDEEVYVVEIMKPAGGKQTNYYSVKTGLLLASEVMEESPNGSFLNEQEFSNYKATNNVMFPYSILQTVGPQKMDIKVESVEVNGEVDPSMFVIEK